MNDNHYTIGELARISSVTVRRIRFYSDEGLLPPLTRTSGNYRVYSDDDVARLQLIRALREAGVGLDAINIGSITLARFAISNCSRSCAAMNRTMRPGVSGCGSTKR
jgi:hypothetical protein